MTADRPNLVLVMFDTARANAFEPYGAPAGASPTVRQLASRGAALPCVIAPASWTMPSPAAMLSGLLPRQARLARAPGGTPPGCRPRSVSFAVSPSARALLATAT